MDKDRKNLLLSVNVKVGRIYFNKTAVQFMMKHDICPVNIFSTANACLIGKGKKNLYSYQGSFYIVSAEMVSLLKRFFNMSKNFTLEIQAKPARTSSENGKVFNLVMYDKSNPVNRPEDIEAALDIHKEAPEPRPKKRGNTGRTSHSNYSYTAATITISRLLRLHGI